VFNDSVKKRAEDHEGRDLRAELIAAATAMLARPQAVRVPSLRSIARSCGVAPSAVYWHFPSEADLRSAVLDAEYTSLIEDVRTALETSGEQDEPLVVAGNAYIAWALAHPGAYQLLFESHDELPATRADQGPALQRRIVELARRVDPDAPFAAALMLWSVWHGIVSLRLHKTEWDWGISAEQANLRMVSALIRHHPHDRRASRRGVHRD
jgi:AcrR family transcriptional regulator